MPASTLSAAQWRRLILTAYGPTLLASIGFAAVAPLVALSARDLGASVPLAALIVGLQGVGTLVGDLPAGWVTEKFGEKRAMVAANVLDALALLGAFLSDSLLALGVAIFVTGLSGAVFGLARMTYFTEAIPVHVRARAMSSLGGTFRVGFLLGPLAGAAIVGAWSLSAAYLFAAGMSLLAAMVTFALPDLPDAPVPAPHTPSTSLVSVLVRHRRTLGLLGVGILVIMLVRSVRLAVLPLWSQRVGLDASQTSLLFALSSVCDIALFFPGGAVMDRFGRFWVAAPSMIVIGLGLMLLPLTHEVVGLAAVAVVLGVGNGISAGIVMTLGGDASPAEGRAAFLAGWRLLSDVGVTLGPLLLSGVTVVAGLGSAILALGLLAVAGAGWLALVVPDSPLRRGRDVVS